MYIRSGGQRQSDRRQEGTGTEAEYRKEGSISKGTGKTGDAWEGEQEGHT